MFIFYGYLFGNESLIMHVHLCARVFERERAWMNSSEDKYFTDLLRYMYPWQALWNIIIQAALYTKALSFFHCLGHSLKYRRMSWKYEHILTTRLINIKSPLCICFWCLKHWLASEYVFIYLCFTWSENYTDVFHCCFYFYIKILWNIHTILRLYY